jgi:hypothetical protein
VQVCLVHLVRHSLNYVCCKDRKEVAGDLKSIYQAATLEEAERQLSDFEEKWRSLYPLIARSWRANWAKVAPMFGYPSEVRRAIYTTNAIESLNMTLRAQDQQEPRSVSQRRGGLQVAVFSPQEHQPALDDADCPLEQHDEPVRPPLRGARAVGRAGNQLTYTKSLTRPPA